MKYDYIIFDWNGTLVDDLNINMGICNTMLKSRSLPPLESRELYLEKFDFPIQPFYEYLGFDLKKESFDDIAVEYDEIYEKQMRRARLFPDVPEVLKMLQFNKIPLAIVSASMKQRLEEQTSRLNVQKYFSFLLGADDSKGESKVQRLISWMQKQNIDPKKALLVGDTAHDAEAAAAANCDCVLISRGHNSKSRLQKTGALVFDTLFDAFKSLFSSPSVLIAPDSFKGTFSSIQVCNALENECRKVKKNALVRSIPIADGGEGTVDAFLHISGGEEVYAGVKSPLNNNIQAYFGILPDKTAVIEMAQASGLNVESKTDVLKASTYGTGQLILNALNLGCKRIVIGLGGSATTDAGAGAIEALGAKLLDCFGQPVPLGGAALKNVSKIDLANFDERIKDTEFIILSDVTAPLFGENGAAFVFAPQKGANEEQVKVLDDALRHFSKVCQNYTKTDFSTFPGSGAAGGLGFACLAFLGGTMHSGIDYILDMANFESISKNYDLVVTGEGKMDTQSLMGKAPFGVSKRAKQSKVVAIVGQMAASRELAKQSGISEVFETNPEHKPFELIKDNAEADLKAAARLAFEKLLQIILNLS